MVKLLSLCPLPPEVIKMFLANNKSYDIEVIYAHMFSESRIISQLEDIDIILGDYTFKQKITREIALAAKKVKLIQQPSVGYQHIDISACNEAGIRVANAAGGNTIAVAEHTIMVAMCLLKNIMISAGSIASGEWKQMDISAAELLGKTWGIVGMGRTGKAVAERILPFGVKLIYFDEQKLKERDEQEYNVSFYNLNELLNNSDIISLHCPLTEKTRGLIGRSEIAVMKSTAIILNVARGEILDESALAAAIMEKKIGGAGIDVFTDEPISADNPLRNIKSDRLILTPHVAGVTNESKMRIINISINNIKNVLDGKEPENLVT